MRLLLLFFAALFSVSAGASTQKVRMYRAGISPQPPLVSSPAAACGQAVSYRNSAAGCAHGLTNGSCSYSYSLGSVKELSPDGGICQITSLDPSTGRSFFGQADIGYSAVFSCPPGSSPLPDGTCSDPDNCVAKAGRETVVNWTVGYTRTSNIDADPNWTLVGPPNKLPSGGSICEPTSRCKVSVGAAEAAFQSLSPTTQGLYRLSLDIKATHSGQACTPTDAEKAGADPRAPQPQCTGSIGEVNGVKGCYGTASAPTSSDVKDAKPSKPIAGNPSAGEKPASGEGSGSDGPGRTPTLGDGGPAGGPIFAVGSGTKPDGTTDKPAEGKEQANCGAPGQPKCGIDETGTPSSYEGDKAALDGWKSQVEANRGQIKDSGGGTFDSFNVFFSAPPLVACEAFDLPNEQKITRHCDVVEGTRNVMAYIWALSALWLGLGWIREAI